MNAPLTIGELAVRNENTEQFQQRVGQSTFWLEMSGIVPFGTILAVDTSGPVAQITVDHDGYKRTFSVDDVCCVEDSCGLHDEDEEDEWDEEDAW